MSFDPVSYILAKRGITWTQVKNKLETEGSKNKQYDSDLNGILDKSAMPNELPLIKHSDGTYSVLTLSTISTLLDAQAVNVSLRLNTTTTTKAEYLTASGISGNAILNSTDASYPATGVYEDDYNFGEISFETGDELMQVYVVFQADLRGQTDSGYNAGKGYAKLLCNGVELISISGGGCAYATVSAEYEAPPNGTYTTQRAKDVGGGANCGAWVSAGIRNRYIYQKLNKYDIILSN